MKSREIDAEACEYRNRMRDPDELVRVERNDRFARVHRENGKIESICLRCFLTIKTQRFETLPDAERLHYEVCVRLLKPSD
jgi:hypothetical protein